MFDNTIVQPDMEAAMIDATTVRAHACSSGYKKDSQTEKCLGRSRGGFTTKIHALVEEVKYSMLIADKGYDSNALVHRLEEQNCIAVIPPRKNRENMINMSTGNAI